MKNKVTVYQKYWIMLLSFSITLWISVRTMVEVDLKFYKRDVIDKRLRWWSKRLLRYARVNYKVFNSENFQFEKGKPYVIMSNHASHYDIPLIFVAIAGSIRMLTKKELFKVPIWGKGMRISEFISIDRHNRDQAFKDLEIAKDKMKDGIIVWIAPEGTRSRNGKLGEFKKGGFHLVLQSGAIILPVGIRGSGHILPPKTWDFYRGVDVQIHIGKPIDSTEFDKNSMADLIKLVRKELKKLGGYTKDNLPKFNPYIDEKTKENIEIK